MSPRLERTLKGLVLIGMALFLTNRIVDGTLLFYISPRFAWLTWVATILLALMAFAYQRTKHVDPHDAHGHGSEYHHHDHHHSDDSTWITLALVALPLLLGILVPPRPLGAQAVGVRKVNTDGVGLVNDEAVLTVASAERNILDWLRAFNATDDPDSLTGQTAQVIGFVFRDEEYDADQFMVSRFVISCCVADATVLGLIVSWPDSLNLPNDAWVEVEGTFQSGQFNGKTTPILVADRVTPTSPPGQPYLYP